MWFYAEPCRAQKHLQEDKKSQRGRHSIFQYHLLFWGASIVQWANQIGSLQKNQVGLMKHPQLINMKQNKVPLVYNGGRVFFANY